MATTEATIIPRLRSVPMFSECSAEDLVTLARMMRYQRLQKGSFIIGRRECRQCMYLLLSGRVKISLGSQDGKELALHFLEAPAHFGEMSLVGEETHVADVIALTDVEVLLLDSKDLAAAVQLQPRIALSLIATLSRRLRHAVQRLEDLAFHDAQHRVMRVLMNVATASYEARGVPVVTGLTHYEIATLAGTSRETASRVISHLAREGVLVTKGRTIVVDLLHVRDRLASPEA